MTEEWRDIEGYENLYQISSLGRVRSLDKLVNSKNGSLRLCKGKIMSLKSDKDGYLQVNFTKNGKLYTHKVHRLVAQAFIPNPENKHCIDHVNTIKDDNRIENLRWVTHKENFDNPLSKTKHKDYYLTHVGSKHPCAKKYIQFSKDGDLIRVWDSAVDVYNAIGVNPKHISACCTGKRKTAGGSKWEYYNTDIYLIALMNKTIKDREKKRVA